MNVRPGPFSAKGLLKYLHFILFFSADLYILRGTCCNMFTFYLYYDAISILTFYKGVYVSIFYNLLGKTVVCYLETTHACEHSAAPRLLPELTASTSSSSLRVAEASSGDQHLFSSYSSSFDCAATCFVLLLEPTGRPGPLQDPSGCSAHVGLPGHSQ